MNVGLPINTLFVISEPLFLDIIRDIVITKVEPKSDLYQIRETLCHHLASITNKTHFFFDADIRNVVQGIMRDRTIFISHGSIIITAIAKWVSADTTHWDKDLIIPAINIFRRIMNGHIDLTSTHN